MTKLTCEGLFDFCGRVEMFVSCTLQQISSSISNNYDDIARTHHGDVLIFTPFSACARARTQAFLLLYFVN